MTSDLAGVEAPKRSGNVAHPVESTPVVVLYEDQALLAVAKPAGLVTHPAYKHPDGTLADAVFARQAARGEDRPWLLHRLDRETSGVVLFAKTEAARRALVRQFECRTMQKGYLAITDGVPSPAEDTVEEPLRRNPADRRRVIADPSGQPAATRFWTLQSTATHALVLAQPLTGRTHQIRVHLATRGAAILGDATYAPPDRSPSDLAARTTLHAWRLVIAYPSTRVPSAVEAPIPLDFAETAERIGFGKALARIVELPSWAVALTSEHHRTP